MFFKAKKKNTLVQGKSLFLGAIHLGRKYGCCSFFWGTNMAIMMSELAI